MPDFDLLPLDEAIGRYVSSAHSEAMAEYLGYINRLRPGEAGRLQIREGEDIGKVRMQLGAAARLAGKNLIIRRARDEIIFWLSGADSGDSLLVNRARSTRRAPR